jgi:hypothetical protein
LCFQECSAESAPWLREKDIWAGAKFKKCFLYVFDMEERRTFKNKSLLKAFHRVVFPGSLEHFSPELLSNFKMFPPLSLREFRFSNKGKNQTLHF